jgi:hypothetical protein
MQYELGFKFSSYTEYPELAIDLDATDEESAHVTNRLVPFNCSNYLLTHHAFVLLGKVDVGEWFKMCQEPRQEHRRRFALVIDQSSHTLHRPHPYWPHHWQPLTTGTILFLPRPLSVRPCFTECTRTATDSTQLHYTAASCAHHPG